MKSCTFSKSLKYNQTFIVKQAFINFCIWSYLMRVPVVWPALIWECTVFHLTSYNRRDNCSAGWNVLIVITNVFLLVVSVGNISCSLTLLTTDTVEWSFSILCNMSRPHSPFIWAWLDCWAWHLIPTSLGMCWTTLLRLHSCNLSQEKTKSTMFMVNFRSFEKLEIGIQGFESGVWNTVYFKMIILNSLRIHDALT